MYNRVMPVFIAKKRTPALRFAWMRYSFVLTSTTIQKSRPEVNPCHKTVTIEYNGRMLRRLATAVTLVVLALGVTAMPVSGETSDEWRKASPAAREATLEALSQVGAPYRYASSDPETGFDCSGLVAYAYDGIVDLPRNSRSQIQSVTPVEWPLPGDLVYYPGHVMLYIGNGQIVHAPYPGTVVEVRSLPERDDLRFGRVVTTPDVGQSGQSRLGNAGQSAHSEQRAQHGQR